MTMRMVTERQLAKYTRLSPTVLYRVPLCYAAYKPDPTSEACAHCLVRSQCIEKQEVILR